MSKNKKTIKEKIKDAITGNGDEENNDTSTDDAAAEKPAEPTAGEIADRNAANLKKHLLDSLDAGEKAGPFKKLRKLTDGLLGHGIFREFHKFIGEKGLDFLRFVAKNWEFLTKTLFITALEIRDRNDGKFGVDDIDDLIKEASIHAFEFAKENPDKIEAAAQWIEWAIRIVILILQVTGRIG